MTCNVFGGTLSLTQSINHLVQVTFSYSNGNRMTLVSYDYRWNSYFVKLFPFFRA